MTSAYKLNANGNSLIINKADGSSKIVAFSAPIQQALLFDSIGTAYVVIEPEPGMETVENLYWVELADARIKWRKAAPTSRLKSNTFTRIQIDPDRNLLVAWDWDGYRHLFDLVSGDVVESHFFK